MRAARTAVGRALVALLVATPLVATAVAPASAAVGSGTHFRHGHQVGRNRHQSVKIGTALRITRNADGSVTYSESR
jgi:hypothetical protein